MKWIIRLWQRFRRFLFGKSGVFYVGGAENLPAPLESDREAEIIDELMVEEKRENARKILIEHNLRLVVYIAKKFENTGVMVEDLISIGTIGLIKSIDKFLKLTIGRLILNKLPDDFLAIRKPENLPKLPILRPVIAISATSLLRK